MYACNGVRTCVHVFVYPLNGCTHGVKQCLVFAHTLKKMYAFRMCVCVCVCSCAHATLHSFTSRSERCPGSFE